MKKSNTEIKSKYTYEDKYDEIVIEDAEAIETIGALSAARLKHIFGLHFVKNEHGETEPKMPIIIFTETFDAVIEYLAKARRGMIGRDDNKYNEFHINFANRFNIGYDNIENDEDEKEGNFMIFIQDTRESKTVEEPKDTEMTPTEKAVEWINQNIIEQSEAISDISIEAKNRLAKLDLVFHSSDLIMPIFCTVYDVMVEYMALERAEKEPEGDDYEINFAGAFFVMARENEKGGSDIIFRPSIDSKTMLKDDATSGV